MHTALSRLAPGVLIWHTMKDVQFVKEINDIPGVLALDMDFETPTTNFSPLAFSRIEYIHAKSVEHKKTASTVANKSQRPFPRLDQIVQ